MKQKSTLVKDCKYAMWTITQKRKERGLALQKKFNTGINYNVKSIMKIIFNIIEFCQYIVLYLLSYPSVTAKRTDMYNKL